MAKESARIESNSGLRVMLALPAPVTVSGDSGPGDSHPSCGPSSATLRARSCRLGDLNGKRGAGWRDHRAVARDRQQLRESTHAAMQSETMLRLSSRPPPEAVRAAEQHKVTRPTARAAPVTSSATAPITTATTTSTNTVPQTATGPRTLKTHSHNAKDTGLTYLQ